LKKVLPIIVVSQFFCTSLWFAGNGVMADLIKQFHLEPSSLAYLTSLVQFGFIIGTLIFSILSIADRFPPSRVFFVCATIAAIANIAITFDGINANGLMIFRFLTGFFLAGIYPVGMKIASDYTEKGLGKSLGFLVGALVIGTAFPHLLKSIGGFYWATVLVSTSILSFMGGLAMIAFVPNGPFRKVGQEFNFSSFLSGFKEKKFRAAAFGYFGHQWELYAFWVFLPVILTSYQAEHASITLNIPLLSFSIIAVGALACMWSGMLAQRFGTKSLAMLALIISGTCCVVSPLVLLYANQTVLISFLLVWGMAVVADSPLFSTLIAQHAIPELKGTSLTIVICIGFAITIASIQLISALKTSANEHYIYMILALGPIFGLISLRKSKLRNQ
jgi:MFS family permease